MKALFVPLATGPFLRFHGGTKTVEVRQHKRQWNERVVTTGRPVVLSRGYGRANRIENGVVGRVVVAPTLADLPGWALDGADLGDPREPHAKWFDAELPVLAFEVVPASCHGWYPSQTFSTKKVPG